MDYTVILYICIVGLLLEINALQSVTGSGPEKNYISKLLAQPKCENAWTETSTLPKSCGQGYSYPGSFMHVVEDALEHQCDLVDPMRGYEENYAFLNDEAQVDFVVVGAGTAGSVVAARLANTRERWKVALLEAGGPYPTGTMIPGSYFSYAKPDSAINWNFALQPEPTSCLGRKNGQCHIPRGKVLGGTSVLHGMMYMRGNPYDYNRWAEEGNKGWSYEDVLPFFKKSERNIQIGDIYKKEFHGSSGPVTVSQFRHHPKFAEKLLAAGGEMGYSVGQDPNGESQFGFTLAQATNLNGSRLSLYNAYVMPLLGRLENLIVSPYSFVTKILLDGETAIGVEYIRNNRTHRVYACKEVIICGGAIHSPQILLQSGIGPKGHLTEMNIPVLHHLPQVGNHLHNHISFSVKFRLKEYESDYLNVDSLFEYLNERKGPLTSTGLSQVTGFVRVNELDGSPKNIPQIQIFFEGLLANCSKGDKKRKETYITITPTLLRPKSKGTVTLSSSNPFDPPKISANYLAAEEDIVTLIDGIRFALKMSNTSILKDLMELDIAPTSHCKAEFGSDDYWRCAIRHWNNPENHQCGTCKMGNSAENSVVDTQLRVHGLKDLRIIDASIMPNVVSGNINGPVIMIAERGAEFIKNRWSYL